LTLKGKFVRAEDREPDAEEARRLVSGWQQLVNHSTTWFFGRCKHLQCLESLGKAVQIYSMHLTSRDGGAILISCMHQPAYPT
jgi:hypothetical protein